MTYHGLRHTYAFEQHQHLILKGYDKKNARYKVSLLIGHSREDVTRIYLVDK